MFKVGDKLTLGSFNSEYEITGIYYDLLGEVGWYSWRCWFKDGSHMNSLTTKEYTEKNFVLRGRRLFDPNSFTA